MPIWQPSVNTNTKAEPAGYKPLNHGALKSSGPAPSVLGFLDKVLKPLDLTPKPIF